MKILSSQNIYSSKHLVRNSRIAKVKAMSGQNILRRIW